MSVITFGIRLHEWGDGISLLTRVNRHAPLPFGLGFQHPAHSTHRLADALQHRVARRNLIGFHSMVPRPQALGPQVAGSSLLLGYIWDLGLAVAGRLLAMSGQFIVGVHLVC